MTRPEYIQIWNDAFEFDNFSCKEIAAAMNQLAKSQTCFTVSQVKDCKISNNSGSSLQTLYKSKAEYALPKIKLTEILIENMMSPDSKRKIENRPIIKILEKVVHLAVRNPLPIRHESWEKNQESKYFGMKRKTSPKR